MVTFLYIVKLWRFNFWISYLWYWFCKRIEVIHSLRKKLLFISPSIENIEKRNFQKGNPTRLYCIYFVYDRFLAVCFKIYAVLVSGFISLLLYFMKETIDISFRGTFRNLQNFTKPTLPLRGGILLIYD